MGAKFTRSGHLPRFPLWAAVALAVATVVTLAATSLDTYVLVYYWMIGGLLFLLRGGAIGAKVAVGALLVLPLYLATRRDMNGRTKVMPLAAEVGAICVSLLPMGVATFVRLHFEHEKKAVLLAFWLAVLVLAGAVAWFLQYLWRFLRAKSADHVRDEAKVVFGATAFGLAAVAHGIAWGYFCVLLFCDWRGTSSVLPGPAGTYMDDDRSDLTAEAILLAEFDYAKATALQANEDRARVTSYISGHRRQRSRRHPEPYDRAPARELAHFNAARRSWRRRSSGVSSGSARALRSFSDQVALIQELNRLLVPPILPHHREEPDAALADAEIRRGEGHPGIKWRQLPLGIVLGFPTECLSLPRSALDVQLIGKVPHLV